MTEQESQSLKAENELLRSQLSQAIELRDTALGRSGLSDRRCVEAAAEILRLRRQRRTLAGHVVRLLRAERGHEAMWDDFIRAISLPPLFWPFAGIATWAGSWWRESFRSVRAWPRKEQP